VCKAFVRNLRPYDHELTTGYQVSSGGFSYSDLQSIIETHIANVVGHYAGACHHWDVVNEAADDSGNWRSSVFYDTMGTDFLAISFNAAKAADPSAKLYAGPPPQ
jgi:endo-1,4-beta-xylanase